MAAMRASRGDELKFHDVDLDDAVIAAGANVTGSINLIRQGVTENQRIGRKCVLRAIGWRFDVGIPDTTSTSAGNDVVRVILYLDKQANAAVAANTAVLESADYQSFNNLANKGRFLTLMDRTYSPAATAAAGDGTTNGVSGLTIPDTFFKKVDIPLEFKADVGDITDLTSNNLGVILCSRDGLATFASKIRLRFTDG